MKLQSVAGKEPWYQGWICVKMLAKNRKQNQPKSTSLPHLAVSIKPDFHLSKLTALKGQLKMTKILILTGSGLLSLKKNLQSSKFKCMEQEAMFENVTPKPLQIFTV